MNRFSVICPHCQAALEIEAGLSAFSCPNCAQTVTIESGTEPPPLSALQRLEAEWQREEATYLVCHQETRWSWSKKPPEMKNAVVRGIALVILSIGLFLFIPATEALFWTRYALSGFMMLGGIGALTAGVAHVQRYERAKAHYQQRKAELERAMNSTRQRNAAD